MATKELRVLRHQYKAAYTKYMHCVQALSDATLHGHWPTNEVLALEEQALNDLVSTRRQLLDALRVHTQSSSPSRSPMTVGSKNALGL